MNFTAVLLATITMFAVGATWYMGPFSKIWGQIHGFDKLSKKEQKEAQAKMGPYYLVQIVITFISAAVLSKLISILPNYSAYTLACLVWAGFVLPAQVSAVIFGGTEPKWIAKKSSIMTSEALLHLLIAAWVIGLIQ
ncbi:MAG: DUF1761 domain-containing protein [Candidatus Saccharibacteria bacterium]|nr:DUF1761 domain-containing protein [Candidatus Saccharibacteria bacterium]